MPARKVIRPDAAGPFSPGLVVDGWVYLAGQGGFDPETGELGPDIAAQTAQTIENVAALLEEAGCTLKDVVSCLVHVGVREDPLDVSVRPVGRELLAHPRDDVGRH